MINYEDDLSLRVTTCPQRRVQKPGHADALPTASSLRSSSLSYSQHSSSPTLGRAGSHHSMSSKSLPCFLLSVLLTVCLWLFLSLAFLNFNFSHSLLQASAHVEKVNSTKSRHYHFTAILTPLLVFT